MKLLAALAGSSSLFCRVRRSRLFPGAARRDHKQEAEMVRQPCNVCEDTSFALQLYGQERSGKVRKGQQRSGKVRKGRCVCRVSDVGGKKTEVHTCVCVCVQCSAAVR
jgi:hypothetical protein